MLAGDHKLYFESLRDYRGQWATGATTEADAEVFHVGEDAVIRHDEKAIPGGTVGGRLMDYAGRLGGWNDVRITEESTGPPARAAR